MGAVTYTTSSDFDHNNNYNLLRLVAALFVFITHSYGLLGKREFEPLIYLSGNRLTFAEVGLYMFFFISGQLVTQSAKRTRTWQVFAWKRILRIYPALFAVVFLTTFLIGPLFTSLSLKEYVQNRYSWIYLTSASGFRVQHFLPGVFEPSHKSVNISLWTLTIELKLYALLCLFTAFKLFNYKKVYSLVCMCVLGVYITSLYDSSIAAILLPESMKLIAMFFMGSLLANIRIDIRLQMLIIFVGVILSLMSVLYNSCKNLYPLGEFIFFSVFTYYLGTSLPSIKIKEDISYGLYLIGFPVQQVLFALSDYRQSVSTNLLLGILLSSLFAFLIWMFIEKPCLQLKRYL
jgi:peptidoglycan/LPS O-acetylase OafA/YrhL